MICELCGKSVNDGFKVRLEGSVVQACPDCSKHGDIVSAVRPAAKPKPAPKPVVQVEEAEEAASPAGVDLVDDYGAKVKAARERLGWTQEDLGRAVNEAHSLVHRIELGRFEPSENLARRLEGKLKVRLLAPHEEVEATRGKTESKEVTLGDLVVVKKRNK